MRAPEERGRRARVLRSEREGGWALTGGVLPSGGSADGDIHGAPAPRKREPHHVALGRGSAAPLLHGEKCTAAAIGWKRLGRMAAHDAMVLGWSDGGGEMESRDRGGLGFALRALSWRRAASGDGVEVLHFAALREGRRRVSADDGKHRLAAKLTGAWVRRRRWRFSGGEDRTYLCRRHHRCRALFAATRRTSPPPDRESKEGRSGLRRVR